MLRFLVSMLLRLLAGFFAAGLLLFRAWGWNEYVSPELYVVYYQLAPAGVQYFIVSTDGGDRARLAWEGEPPAKLDCSPDGRTLAFLTGDAHLYVTTSAGLLYERAEPEMYTTVSVANDGTSALFDAATGKLRLDSREIDLNTPDKPVNRLDRYDISAQGLVLRNRNFQDIQVTSLTTGEQIASVGRAFSGEWLASGGIFVFSNLVTSIDGIAIGGGTYVMDMGHQVIHQIGTWVLSRPLSPDGTRVAAALTSRLSGGTVQVFVYNLFGSSALAQLTDDPSVASQPLCFLTFKPEILTNDT
jgi:WD40 repeat protein